MEAKRIDGIDLVRSFAVAFVVLIHTMMFLGIWSHNLSGITTFSELMIYRLTWVCVPLFLMLTGYLNYKKEASKKYFVSIGKTFLIFLFYSLLVIIFRIVYQNEEISIWNGIKMILGNATQDRAWYMNMYFGLVLVVPFINVAWKMFNKQQKIIILIVLYLLTSVSKYIYTISGHLMDTPIVLISSYWWGLYFFVYYFLGAFIREYPIKIPKKIILLSLIVLLILHTSVYFMVNNNEQYGDMFLHQTFWYDNPILFIEALLFFLLFHDLKVKNKVVSSINREISLSALEIYLFSIITDTICYNYFVKLLPDYPYLWLVLLMWISSFTLAFIFTFSRRKLLRFL